ncbi:hypothetical protein [Cellulophaga baltica]|jgi:hypothetical protein|uniref:hypothetical protein n=1 Tax=Cellulophaga baltica TaxID=76594 RepID=UPI000427E4E9|nr:hypothetical protein [Cellulophaga baltica]
MSKKEPGSSGALGLFLIIFPSVILIINYLLSDLSNSTLNSLLFIAIIIGIILWKNS